MDITFVGVGEAFDEQEPNTSILIEHDGKLLLCDCGYAVPPALWKINADQNALWGLYLSHYHPDHCFGVVPLLMRMGQEKRTKPLHIIGQEDCQHFVSELLEMGEPGFSQKLPFKLEYASISYLPASVTPFTFTAARTTHLRRNFAVRIEAGDKRVCYMGDGNFTPEVIALADKADLLVIDCNYELPENPSHASLKDVMRYLPRLTAKKIALVHINRMLRGKFMELQFPAPLWVPRAREVVHL